ncbi:MAG: zinc-ribbon domain-containing protein [Thermogemmatispora sp.]|uniref:zinc-ribbon domain-containing protein n=1 Tax=Thermogemmatispora sp. TaxID=1968838 RepID=UPI00260A7D9A|nr:zinc-ribbon domain-containing protein [Thermogemmatispora sp.]MBX5457299.1 zinc-ribbon domain-containing protein [Thermogemmatispora sp.]
MYVIVYGYRTRQWLMGRMPAVCQRCQRTSQQQIVRLQRKLTLFWIPLFPIMTRTFLVCPLCGNQMRVDNKQANAWVKSPAAPPSAYPGPSAPPGVPGAGGPETPPQPGNPQQPGSPPSAI